MWPLNVDQLAIAMAGLARPLLRLDPELGRAPIYRAISWLDPTLGPRDAFFVVDWKNHAIVSEALESGVICIVAKTWGGLADLDPATRPRCFVAENPLYAYRALAAFMRKRFTFPVIAVGGSNGKTTTKNMITRLLETSGRTVTSTPGTNNGWTGTPVTLCRAEHRQNPPPLACVIEIGIDEKGAMADHVRIAEPDLAVLTALGPEHLSGLGTHEDAINEELVLFEGSKRRVWLADDPALFARLDRVRADDIVVASTSLDVPITAAGASLLRYDWSPSSSAATEGSLSVTWRGETHDFVVPMPGAHNGRNAALAIAVALDLGQSEGAIRKALAEFRGPEQRCVVKSDPAIDVTLIDDTYNASPSSIEAALGLLTTSFGSDGRLARLLILGDMLDLGDEADRWHAAIAPTLAGLKNTHVRLYGDHMPKIAALLGDNLLSIGIAKKDEDPTRFLDDVSLANGEPRVILVKGSRGMALERVVSAIESRLRLVNAESQLLRVGVVAEDVDDLARALRSLSMLPHDHVFVRALRLEDLEAGDAQRQPYDVAVFGNLPWRRTDVESDLAAMAQLLVSLKEHGTAVFWGDREGDAEARELLAGVGPTFLSSC